MDNNLLTKLDQYFTVGMTPFQMRNFVINDFMTAYRQMRQIIIEMKTRISNKTSVEFDIEELEIEIAELDNFILNSADEFVRAKQNVSKKRKMFALAQKQTLLTQIEFELQTFGDALDLIIRDWGGVEKVVEDLQSDSFHEQHEQDFWIQKMSRNAATDLINYGTISKGTIESIKLMPDEAQHKVLQLAMLEQFDTTQHMLASKDNVLTLRDK